MLQLASKMPPKVVEKAKRILADYAVGAGNVVQTKHHSGRCVSIRVGLRYRLLRRCGGTSWVLCTHEKYNTMRKHI